jgi:RNA recognition motif-containing protein
MAKKLFVGGLPWATTNDDLKDLFSQAGTVASATIITDKMTGRSRGFGFVEFESDADADNALSMFNGKEYNGRNLVVNEAKPMTDRPQRSGGFGGGGGRGGYGGRDQY